MFNPILSRPHDATCRLREDAAADERYIRQLQARIEDLQHELCLARQHLDVCPTAVAIAEEDAAKRRAG